MTGPAIDDVTGMPVVPEGYFWRVEKIQESIYGDLTFLRVSLRRNDPVWYNKKRSEFVHHKEVRLESSDRFYKGYRGTWPYMKDPDKYKSLVVLTATQVYLERQDQIEAFAIAARAKTVVAELVGDYPPKTLEN